MAEQSSLKQQSSAFKRHWVDWVWLLKEDGESEDDIKTFQDEIRNNWHDDEYRNSVCLLAKERSEFRQELIGMARKLNERIKQNVANAN